MGSRECAVIQGYIGVSRKGLSSGGAVETFLCSTPAGANRRRTRV